MDQNFLSLDSSSCRQDFDKWSRCSSEQAFWEGGNMAAQPLVQSKVDGVLDNFIYRLLIKHGRQ